MVIYNHTHILVCGPDRALILVNETESGDLHLDLVEALERDGSSTGPDAFVDRAADAAQRVVRWMDIRDLVIVADIAALRRLRPQFREISDVNVLAEISEDLSNAALPDIERSLSGFPRMGASQRPQQSEAPHAK